MARGNQLREGGAAGRLPYEQLRNGILDGTFPPGTQLVEVTIAEQFGVSRTPVREALTRLEQDGLVERGPRGLIVRERSPQEILDLYEVRIVLEATAARLAAERHTPYDKVQLQRALEACRQADLKDPPALAEANSEFHVATWHASHNSAIIDLLNRLDMHLLRYPETTLSYPGRWEEAQREHEAILQAIIDRDSETAGAIAERHFTRAREIRLELWGATSISKVVR